MSQDEFREMLPGHADFKLPKPAPPAKVNGRRPIPEKPATETFAPSAPSSSAPSSSAPSSSAPSSSVPSEADSRAHAAAAAEAHATQADAAHGEAHSRDGHPAAGYTPADQAAADQGAADQAAADQAAADRDPVDVWDQRVAAGLAFVRRRLAGAYEVDEFGFDRDLTDSLFHPVLKVLYRDWFRTEVFGIENVPDTGGGLIVGNHSGTIALDALMLTVAVRDQHPLERHLRLLGADLVFRVPMMSELARKSGVTVACNPDAERLMSGGQLVGVFPEGFKGIGKRFADRYKLQRFGRGGFVSAALRTGTPIIPVAIVGAEETYPILADVKPLARLLGIPYFPLTPTFPWLGPLGLVPLPSKWLIQFGTPIPTAHLTEHADDPMVVYNLADQVRETIQATLHELLERRPEAFGR